MVLEGPHAPGSRAGEERSRDGGEERAVLLGQRRAAGSKAKEDWRGGPARARVACGAEARWELPGCDPVLSERPPRSVPAARRRCESRALGYIDAAQLRLSSSAFFMVPDLTLPPDRPSVPIDALS